MRFAPPVMSAAAADSPEKSPSTAPAAASKLPIRPRKLRKLCPSSSTNAAAAPLRSLPRPGRPLSSPGELPTALLHLAAADPLLTPLLSSLPPPSLHPRTLSPFLSLARYLVNHHLSLKSATVAFSSLLSLLPSPDPSPSSLLSLPSSQLRLLGLSSRKSSCLHDLARKFHSGLLSDDGILSMDDGSLLSMLTMVEGIGKWSAQMFMIFELHRPDVLPVGDLGFRKGVQILYGLEEVPRPSEMEGLCERWRPYRSVGAWYMWRLVGAKMEGGVGGGGGPGEEEVEQQPAILLDIV